MSEKLKYNKQTDRNNRLKLYEIKQSLPSHTYLYLDEKADTNPNTAVAYARDLCTFFEYLKDFNPELKHTEVKNITCEQLEKLTFQDINEYQHFLDENHPEISGSKEHNNGKAGIARRMAALRGYFEYQCLHGFMNHDPSAGSSKIRVRDEDHTITRMTVSEVQTFLNTVKNADIGSNHQRKLLQKTKYRDYAILTLLLNTGIRVSECVGLDLDDLNFHENSMKIFRKGHKEQFIYFSQEVADVISEYVELERPAYLDSEEQKALFLSTQKKRMAVRSIQEMVKKYAEVAVSNKKLSPHKMRSTYGTALYNQTGDIRLVADVLGHKDINTTSKHYAAMEDERRRMAAKINPYSKE